jgi:hypothetical protein
MKLSRRHFLATGAVLPGFAAPASPRSGQAWYQTMRRCGQVNFNEMDPGRLDIAQCVEYWSDLRVDALLLNAGGILAFYPTKIAGHHRAQSLGDGDLFGAFAKAAKERGIRVVARLDCNLAYEETLRLRPEWFVRSADAQPVKHSESPSLFHTCMFSSYFTEQMPAIIREVNALYEVDGFFTSGWPGTGPPPDCRCEACRRLAGRNTPAFTEQHLARVLEIWKLWDNAAKEKKLDSIYVGGLGGGIRATTNLRRLASVAGWFNADHRGRSGATPIWDCAQEGRVAQSVMKGRPITNMTGWMAQTTASGMVPWLGGVPEGQRWQAPGREFFQWTAKYDPHFVNRKPIASLGVVFSQRMNALYTPPGGGAPSDFLQGMYYALLEGRFLFDFVHEDDLEPATLKKYAAVILPNTAILSDAQCAQLRAYARNGGGMLATFESGLYDDAGAQRKELGLADVFGAALAGEMQGPKGNSHYARIEERHAILAGFEETSLLPGAEYRLPVKTRLPQAMTVVPPENVDTHTPKTDEPAIVITEEGMSRRVWLPGDVERSFWRSGNGDLSRLLQQAIRWVARDRMPVRVSGEGLVELFAWETELGYAVHILNYTNPLGAQTVRLDLPEGVKVKKVQALRAGTELKYKVTGQTLEFTLAGVRDYEIAAVTRA